MTVGSAMMRMRSAALEVCLCVCARGLDGWGLFLMVNSRKEQNTMLLQGLVLSGDVLESTFYDQSTGQPKPGYSVKLTVLDAETDEKYECQVSEGFPSLDQ